MNNWVLPFFVLFADRGKRNRTGVVEAMLTSSNQIPEAPRTLFAVTQAIDQADRQEQQQKAVAKQEEDLAKLIDDGKLRVSTDLSDDPRMQFMIGKLSDPALKERVIKKLNPSGASPESGATGTSIQALQEEAPGYTAQHHDH